MLRISTALRRALGMTVAAGVAAGGLAIAAPTAQAMSTGSCTSSFSPQAIRPGEQTTMSVQTLDDEYYPAIQLVNGHVVPGATVSIGTMSITQNYSWWESFGNGRPTSSAGYRIYAPGTNNTTATDDTPYLCGGEVTFLPDPTAQTITFPAISDTPLATGSVDLGATASSGLAVTYASDTTDVCAVDGDTLTLLAQGECHVTATQGGDEEYAAASNVDRWFWVQLPQTITFPAIADQPLSNGTVALDASATSGNYIGYSSSTPAVCTTPMLASPGRNVARNVSRGMGTMPTPELTLKAVGTCTVTASTWSGGGWLPAADVSRSFQVYVPAPAAVLSVTVPGGIALSQGTATFSATSTVKTSSVHVASATPSVCRVATGSTVTLATAGTCTLTAAQSGAASVTKSFPVWSAPTIPAKGRTTQTVTVLGQGESALKVAASPADVCRASGGAVLLIAPGTCDVKVTRGDRTVRRGSIEVTFNKAAKPAGQLTHGGTAYFAFDSARLTAKAKQALKGHLPTLRKASVVVVYGNTYGPGRNSAHSRKLAADRAAAVVGYLKAHGVKAHAVTVAAAMQNPVSKNPAKNRRADVYYRD